jgi:L-rhamnose-H+ transport protein
MQAPVSTLASLSLSELLIVAAAMINAAFTLPLKRMRQWPWENAWLIWTFSALIIFPLVAALLTIPNLAGDYREVDRECLLKICSYGVGWGMAQVLLGLAVEPIGVALSFSIVLGMSAAVGTMIPFVRLQSAALLQQTGAVLISGLALVVLGVGLCALAGRRREQELHVGLNPGSNSFKFGVTCALASGVLASMMNLGISFGAPLLKLAVAHDASPLWCANVIWVPLLAAGAVPNIVYCLYLFRKHRSTIQYSEVNLLHCWLLSVLMGALWFGGHLLYGMGISFLGTLGPTLGWPIYMSFLVISAGLYGFLAGEWRRVSTVPIRFQLAGMIILCVAVFIFSKVRP